MEKPKPIRKINYKPDDIVAYNNFRQGYNLTSKEKEK